MSRFEMKNLSVLIVNGACVHVTNPCTLSISMALLYTLGTTNVKCSLSMLNSPCVGVIFTVPDKWSKPGTCPSDNW